MTEIQVDTTQNTAHCQRTHIHQPATCRNRKGRKALCRSESVDLCGTCRKIFWCRGPDSNRQAVKRRIFFTPRLSTPSAKSFALSANVRALDYAFAIARAPSPARADRRTGLRRPPSSLYTFHTSRCCYAGGLGSALPRRRTRDVACDVRTFAPGGSPNLRGSTPAVSGRALNFLNRSVS